MTKRMLIDATHAEETRVVVLDGIRLEDFDVETAAKKQLKGNIYLAKVVRVEPSLQAAFVEYGGGRHGFLAFGEIHPDYYQIPVADRQRLLELQEAEARAEEEADDAAAAAEEAESQQRNDKDGALRTIDHDPADSLEDEPGADAISPSFEIVQEPEPDQGDEAKVADEADDSAERHQPADAGSEPVMDEPPLPLEEQERSTTQASAIAQDFLTAREEITQAEHDVEESQSESDGMTVTEAAELAPEAAEALNMAAPARADEQGLPLGDDSGSEHADESREARAPARFMRSYKIQEVIRRRQILLVQVVKEERGSKGAALTTYISLAGRFSVLMPNSPRGGGISRKITSMADRRRLKEVISELQIPRGMGLIVRTAGANRPKAEIRRDCEYLLELWDSVRESTMASTAPALIHEEANLIRRAIRDNYSRDVDEVLVDGEAGWRAARDFMRMLMPAHARKVILWNDPQPLFARQQVEAQLDAMLLPTVQLKSGGYLVINQTEALVAIDVNSGRSTRERGIEETALKTNLEAADEVGRQLRLRDLAGLIVIDFIDMESRRNNAAVERRMKDATKDDRARIQLGPISAFGLMEMSRQRLRPSLAETSFTACPHCGGTGHVRSTETSALAVLRAIEDEGAKRRAAEIVVHVAGAIALYVLNHKRVRLAEIEARYAMSVAFAADESLLPPEVRIERMRPQALGEMPAVAVPIPISTRPVDEDDDVAEEDDLEPEDDDSEPGQEAVAGGPGDAAHPGETAEEAEQRNPKRRRRRRGGRREEGQTAVTPNALQPGVDPAVAEQPDLPLPVGGAAAEGEAVETPTSDTVGEEEARGRRRGRRGGRRRRRDGPGELPGEGQGGEADGQGVDTSEESSSFDEATPDRPAYAGPTPADPFGGGVFDIYDVMEQAEARAAAAPKASAPQIMAVEESHVAPPPTLLEAPDRPEVEGELAEATIAAEPGHNHEIARSAAPQASTVADLNVVRETEPELVPETPPQPELEAASEPEAAAEASETRLPPPILVGAGDAAAEKKRGWWRR